jgi:hypothetical protein
MKTTEWILAQLESEAPRTRRALERVPEGQVLRRTTDEHLKKPWRLLVAGNVVSEDPREIVLRDTANDKQFA